MIHHIDLGQTPIARLRRLSALRQAGEITLGGNRKLKIYGTLACRSGRRMKTESRVFFSNAKEAESLGYRPCGHCMRESYRRFLDAQRPD